MSKDVTGEAKFHGREVAMIGSTAGDYRGIRESFGILEAEYTRAVVAKTLHPKLLAVYKAEFHRRFLQALCFIEDKQIKAVVAKNLLHPVYKDDTGEAESQGQEVAMFSGIARDHRSIEESFYILEAETTSGLLKRGY